MGEQMCEILPSLKIYAHILCYSSPEDISLQICFVKTGMKLKNKIIMTVEYFDTKIIQIVCLCGII